MSWDAAADVTSHICRICYRITQLTVGIFEGEGLDQDLPAKLRHLPVAITATDPLPLQLCYECTAALVNWDALLGVCLDTDRKLRALLAMERVSDSDDEPLMPPKKRKIQDLKKDTNAVRSGKSRRKKCTPKKLKKGDEEVDKVKKETSEVVAVELLTEFKAELCESEAEAMEADTSRDTDDGEGGEGGGELAAEGDVGIKCEHCGKAYKRKTCLERHVRQSHGVPPVEGGVPPAWLKACHTCDLCGSVYKSRANLDRHHAKEHLANQVECQVCHASVNSKKLAAHLRTAHGVKTEADKVDKFKCKLCDKWFRNKYARNLHVKETHMPQSVKCKLCDFEGLRAVVRRHRRDVHAEKRFPCTLCDNAFKTLHTLKMHMTAHSDLRCYTCDICGMGFKRLNNVRDHMKCHEEKSNQCQICGNFFARKRYLAIHEKTIHNFYADGVVPEEKGFECGTCGAKLKWKKNLLAHMRIHTGEKPYVCKICKKDFICHGSLRTHMAKHGVCAVSDKTVEALLSPVSVATDEMHDPQAHLQIEMNVFNHFGH